MKKYEKLIKKVYEGGVTYDSVALPKGTTMEMVARYIMNNYKDRNGRPECYVHCDCYSDENMYYWENGFSTRIDIWSGEITIWKE
jgi:hypothetical protein